jgi:hypothetical protein
MYGDYFPVIKLYIGKKSFVATDERSFVKGVREVHDDRRELLLGLFR